MNVKLISTKAYNELLANQKRLMEMLEESRMKFRQLESEYQKLFKQFDEFQKNYEKFEVVAVAIVQLGKMLSPSVKTVDDAVRLAEKFSKAQRGASQ